MTESVDGLGRRALAQLEADDADALIEVCDPDVELRPLIAGVSGSEYRGHEGVRQWFDELSSSFDERRAPIISIDSPSDDALVAEIALHLRGRGSGIEIDMTVYGAGRVRDGLFVWWGFFEARDEALRELAKHR